MQEMQFYMPVPLHCESGCVLAYSHKLAQLGGSCLIVTGRTGARASGALDDVQTALQLQGIEYTVFDEIEENPLVSTCHRAGRAARELGAEFIVAIGGGSALDAGKAVAVYAANSDLGGEEIYDLDWPLPALPCALVPTTAGTSSELDQTAVLTIDALGVKKSVGRADMFPALALVDAKYTYSLPYRATVSTAVDAFSHCAESYFAQNADTISRMFALQGSALLWPSLTTLAGLSPFIEPEQIDTTLRDDISAGCTLAGFSLGRCGTCFPHPLGYLLTEGYAIPHGSATGVFLPAFLQRARRYERGLFDRFLEAVGAPSLASLSATLQKLCPVQVKMDPQQIEGYRPRLQNVKNFARTPGGYTDSDALDLLRQLFL